MYARQTNQMKKTILISLIVAACTQFSHGQILQKDTVQTVEIYGLQGFKNERSLGKQLQIVGCVGMTAYFLLLNVHNNKIKRGEMDSQAPSGVIPIVAGSVMTIGFVIDQAAIDRLFKRKK